MSVDADLHDLRPQAGEPVPALDPDSYAASQAVARQLRGAGSNGIAYPSIRHPSGECVALFYPDCASNPLQGRHLDYHWDCARVDLVRDAGPGAVFRLVDLPPVPVCPPALGFRPSAVASPSAVDGPQAHAREQMPEGGTY